MRVPSPQVWVPEVDASKRYVVPLPNPWLTEVADLIAARILADAIPVRLRKRRKIADSCHVLLGVLVCFRSEMSLRIPLASLPTLQNFIPALWFAALYVSAITRWRAPLCKCKASSVLPTKRSADMLT